MKNKIALLIIAKKIEQAVYDTRIEALEQQHTKIIGDWPDAFERAYETTVLLQKYGVLEVEAGDADE